MVSVRNAWILAMGLFALGALWDAPLDAQDQAQTNERAEELFQLCTSCHGPDGEGNEMYWAPAIAGLPTWYIQAQLEGFRSGLRGLHFDDLAGMRMRPMALVLRSDEDVAAVAEYVGALPPVKTEATLTGGDPQKGAPLYAVCTACHGLKGVGNKDLHAPPLSQQHDWYLFRQLKNFKDGIRGVNPKDTWGVTMRPMSMVLADEQAIKDVLMI